MKKDERLDEERKHWALNVQGRALPFWNEAFDYAYNLGKSNRARRKPRQKNIQNKS